MFCGSVNFPVLLIVWFVVVTRFLDLQRNLSATYKSVCLCRLYTADSSAYRSSPTYSVQQLKPNLSWPIKHPAPKRHSEVRYPQQDSCPNCQKMGKKKSLSVFTHICSPPQRCTTGCRSLNTASPRERHRHQGPSKHASKLALKSSSVMSTIVRCLNKRGVIHGFINAQWLLTAELFAKPNLSAPTGQVTRSSTERTA